MALIVSHAPPLAPNKSLEAGLHDYLETNDYVVSHITKPVKMAPIRALIAQLERPTVLENLIEKSGFRLTDILVNYHPLQARALRVSR